MHPTVIALMAVSLGLVPVPPAQETSLGLEVRDVCAVDTALKAADAVTSLFEQSLSRAGDVCIASCEGGITLRATILDAPCLGANGLPTVGPCPPGTYGVVVEPSGGHDTMATRSTCVDPNLIDPKIGLCPTGSYGVTFRGEGECITLDECPEIAAFSTGIAIDACHLGPECAVGLQAFERKEECDEGQDNGPPPGHDCIKTEDDDGMGGTHVDCKYDCLFGDELAIFVEAHDKSWGKAEADGSTECGGAKADCNIHNADKTECKGASVGPATRKERQAYCKGESHEVWDDSVTVACYSAGVSTVCKIAQAPEVCNRDLLGPLALSSHLACLANLRPAGWPSGVESLIAKVLEVVPSSSVTSFVAFEVIKDGGHAIGSVSTDTGPVCWVQALA